MRILHLIATNFYGGPERQLVRHCERAGNLGYEFTIGTFVDSARENELAHEACKRGIDVKMIPLRSAYDPTVFSKLRTLIAKVKPSIVCTYGYRPLMLGLPIAKALAIPLVAWSTGWTKETFKIRAFEVFDKLLIRFADCVVAVSREQKRRLMRLGLPGQRIQMIHNALDLGEFQREAENSRLDIIREFSIPSNCKTVVAAGRLSPEKGHRYLIESMRLILKRRSDVFLLIVGEGHLKPRLMEIVNRLDLSGRVVLAGFRKDVYQIISQVDALVLPSTTEGLPSVILEAFAAGKPVIATAVGGNPEIVLHMKTGILVPPRSPAKIAEAMDFLLSEPAKARDLANAARELLSAEFSIENQVRKTCNVYQLLQRRFSQWGRR